MMMSGYDFDAYVHSIARHEPRRLPACQTEFQTLLCYDWHKSATVEYVLLCLCCSSVGVSSNVCSGIRSQELCQLTQYLQVSCRPVFFNPQFILSLQRYAI